MNLPTPDPTTPEPLLTAARKWAAQLRRSEADAVRWDVELEPREAHEIAVLLEALAATLEGGKP